MIIAILLVYGLSLGSFVNALVWRVHQQAKQETRTTEAHRLSISKGRSMCPDCRHTLAAKDLVPLFSWLSLRGQCRYCQKPISAQYPLVEGATAVLFVLSYVLWPATFTAPQIVLFVLWLLLLVGFMALTIYDARWMLLPNRIIYPLWAITALYVLIEISSAAAPLRTAASIASGTAIGGGIFLVLFYISKQKWIGYGDVRLGWILGAVVGSAGLSLMVIFVASLLGCLFALPALFTKKLKGTSQIPFGPFLMAATVIVYLGGSRILHWYLETLTGL